MNKIAVHRNPGHSNLLVYSWVLAAIIVVLMVTVAVGSLLAGLVAPDVIGADGLARIALPAK